MLNLPQKMQHAKRKSMGSVELMCMLKGLVLVGNQLFEHCKQ